MPLVVAGAVAAGFALNTTSASGASRSLARKTPAQLIAAVEKGKTVALTGEIRESANLGIPTLPGGHASASLSWQTFVSGSHAAKVWIGSADTQRVALLGELSEADVVHNGGDVWTYTSDTNTVTHTTLPKGKAEHPDPATHSAADLTPAAAASRLLDAVSPTTSVTVDSSRTVAHRAAYMLVLRPKDSGSTVRKVTIAIDARKFVPLQVQVFGAGSTPAFQTRFTRISFAKPKASTFQFRTPAGATTSTNPFGSSDRHGDHAPRPEGSKGDKGSTPGSTPVRTEPKIDKLGNAKPTVLGKGWTSVLEIPTGAQSGLDNGMLHDLTTVGSSGQRLLHTALINALLLPDGRTFVGAVSPSVLEHVAATTPR